MVSLHRVWNPLNVDRYGLGWTVVPQQDALIGPDTLQRFHVGHGGGAVGASSVLVIFPLSPATSQSNATTRTDSPSATTEVDLPCGVTVAIITNLQNASLYKLSHEVAQYFIEACEGS